MLTRRTLLSLPAALALAGCRPEEPRAGAAARPAPAGSKLKVGLMTNGSLSDSGWNSLAGEGLDRIVREMDAEKSHQNASPAEGEEGLRGFARDGCRLVFAHGSEFGDAAKRVAAEFPGTVFVVSSGEVQGPNLASLRFDLGEAGYLAGMAAAALSKRGRAGQIGGENFPPVAQAFTLFERGAKAVNPKFTTTITYLGSWSDATKAKETALSMIRAGADVIFQNADAAGEGVFQAAEESEGVLVIGSNANQNALKPEIIAASAVLDVAQTFTTVAKDVLSGAFKGSVYREDLKSGNVYLAINPAFEDRIPAGVRERIQDAERAIKAGRLNLVRK